MARINKCDLLKRIEYIVEYYKIEKSGLNMKKIKLLLLLSVFFMFVFAGCGRNAKIAGTWIHESDDNFGEFVIVYDGSKVYVEINGEKYEAKMDENVIIVNGQYEILETHYDAEGNHTLENCTKVDIRVLNAKEWI